MAAEHVAVVSRDAALTDEVRRLAALADRTVLVAAQPVECARVCRTAVLVVIDAAALDAFDETVPVSNVVVLADDRHRVAVWEAAMRVRARRVLTLPDETAELLDLIALAGERSGPPGPLVGVVGGSGGAGASVLAVALGWAFGNRGRPTTIADLDVFGGGLDVLAGLENVDGLRWHDLSGARGVVSSAALRTQLPTIDGLAVLSVASGLHPGTADPPVIPERAAMTSVIAAARRGGDVVVADIPRQCVPEVGGVVASCDAVLLVVPAQVRAVSAAASTAVRLRSMCTDIRLVVRADARSRLRDRDVSTALGLPHVATIAAEGRVTAAADRGQLVQSFRRSALGRTALDIVDLFVAGDLERAS